MLNFNCFQSVSGAIAIAVSGGRDSMALAHMLKKTSGIDLHAITVDHRLRKESMKEAELVGQWLADMDIDHTILTWTEEKPSSGLMEAAREARYSLMAAFCKENNIDTLAVAHHADDQAETFLHRFTKGSGLDGLAVMQPTTTLYGLKIIRPILHSTRSQITEYCAQHNIPYVDDPSNEKSEYTRVRFRQFLESEGLDSAAMNRTVTRLSRAADALDKMAHKHWEKCLINMNPLTLDKEMFLSEHEELQVRVLNLALQHVSEDFRPTRLSKIEDALPVLKSLRNGKAYTIGGCVITQRGQHLVFEKEARA